PPAPRSASSTSTPSNAAPAESLRIRAHSECASVPFGSRPAGAESRQDTKGEAGMRRKDRKLDVLGAVPLFGGCDGNTLRRIGMITDEAEADPGVTLTRQGPPGREVCVIVEGHGRVDIAGRRVGALCLGALFGAR